MENMCVRSSACIHTCMCACVRTFEQSSSSDQVGRVQMVIYSRCVYLEVIVTLKTDLFDNKHRNTLQTHVHAVFVCVHNKLNREPIVRRSVRLIKCFPGFN